MFARRKALDDSLATEEWQRLRNLQIAGEADESGPLRPAALSDELSMQDWLRVRDRQVGGASGAMRMAAAAAPSQAKGPLRGRPGTAAVVAGALNTIAGGPNTSAPVRANGVDGVVRRGTGRDVSAEGRIGGIGSVKAKGVLEPPTGRAEVVISKARGRAGLVGVELPDRVRFFNTPGGELDVHLPSDVRIGVVPVARKGTYVIGQPDPQRRK